MADETKAQGTGADVAAKAGTQAKAKKKRTGATKKKGKERVGEVGVWIPLDQPNSTRSADAMKSDGRSKVANGYKSRAAPADNVAAVKPIVALYMKYPHLFDERGLPKVVFQGAELVAEQLSVLLEVESLSARNAPGADWSGELAFVHKLRDAIGRLYPGPGSESTAKRANYGLHIPVREGRPLGVACKSILRGKKLLPQERASKLITASDEKRLRAIAAAVPKATAEQHKIRSESAARTTQRDILNAALELFYDDFAATAGMALADDEVARVQALQLIPRRAEQRAEKKDDAGAGDGSTASGSTSTALVKA